MTADIENLVLEDLRAIRATQADHGERFAQIEVQLSAMSQQLGALTTAGNLKSTASSGASNLSNGDWN